jgi:putative thioredoxin
MAREIGDFEEDVIQRSAEIPVLVDFWAPWCGPCRTLGPVLERLAGKHAGEWELVKVNVDENQEVAMEYQVSSIPNVKLFIDGKVVNEFAGALPEAALSKWLKQAIPGRHDAVLAEARLLIAKGQPELAETMLRQVLQDNAGNREASVMLAQVIVFSEPAQAVALVEDVREGDSAFELADAIRSFAELFEKSTHPETLPDSHAKPHCLSGVTALRKGDFDGALASFIEAMQADRSYVGGCARKACVAIFHYLGEESAITKKHRPGFGAALHV